MTKLSLLACGLLAAVALAACGGDDDPLTVDEYFDRMSEIGGEVETKLEENNEEFDEAAAELDQDDVDGIIEVAGDLFEGNLDAMRDARDEADGLTPPDEVADEHDEFIEALGEFIDELESVADAIGDADDADELFEVLGSTDSGPFADASDRWDAACTGLEEAGVAAGAADTDLGCGS